MIFATVLFVHGLESGPRGRKARALEEAGFSVVAGQMPCGRGAILRDPAVVLAALAILATIGLCASLGGVAGLVVALACSMAALPLARVWLMRRVVRRSLAVQLELLRTNAVDVVIGSSFGGAIALELIGRGAWQGRTVLLCPAHRLVAARTRTPAPSLRADASKVLVVHGTNDETVPIEHSRALTRGTAAQLIEVVDDHRLAATATPENLRGWIAKTARHAA